MTVLEPSAGHGMLAEAARAAGAKVDAVELAVDLREILQAKGFGLVGRFMDTTPAQSYDAVVMNPPFSNDMDIDHVRHAYDHLKPGGRWWRLCRPRRGSPKTTRTKPSVSGLTGWEAVSRPCRMVIQGVAQPYRCAYQDICHRQARQRGQAAAVTRGQAGDGGNPKRAERRGAIPGDGG